MRIDPSNVDQLSYWDGEPGAYWARRATRFDEGVAAYDYLASVDIAPDAEVLDVGCGSGQTTREAARRGRAALGVDLSAPMIELARARSAGIPNVRYERADAQVHEFAPVDVIVSRTGAMFFGDPPAAFANLARALRPGGTLSLMTWQAFERNEWQQALTYALTGRREQRTAGLFNDPSRMRDLLTGAGFRDVAIEGREAPMYFGPDIDDAVAFLAGQHKLSPEAADRLRGEMVLTEGGVRFGSAAWFVTAVR